MTPQEQEIMDILQEECSEVIQMVSKCRRFGLDETHIKTGELNRDLLTGEIGDVMCMIELLQERGVINAPSVQAAIRAKRERLKQWSNIFKEETNEIKSK